MGRTLAEKILDASAGDAITVPVDLLMGHDGTATLCLDELAKYPVFDRDKVMLVCDHFAPPASVERANIEKKFIDFLKEQNLPFHLYDGICHQLLAEDRRVVPGKIIIGADSHTVTSGALGAFATGVGSTDFAYVWAKGEIWLKVPDSYKVEFVGEVPRYIQGKDMILEVLRQLGEDGGVYKALEFHDSTENGISMDSRLSISNMSVECGAKVGMFVPDRITEEFVVDKGGEYNEITPDGDAQYERELVIDVSELEPLIALPHSPTNVKKAIDVEGIELGQVYIGSCTGGRIEDMKTVVELLGENVFKSGVKVIVIPSSRELYLAALRMGSIEKIVRAGGIVCTPSCGPCCNIDKGLLGAGEVGLSTSNRNFRGRMGDYESKLYLASTLTAVASAIEGKIVDPRGYM